MAADQYTIGQLAEEAGIPASTVRYYERIDLLAPAGRSANNYRYYDEAALDKLRFIRTAQASGLTLEDITELLAFREGSQAPCAEIKQLIDHRLHDVQERLDELQQVQAVLRSLKNICKRTENKRHCDALDRLTEVSLSSDSH